MKKYAIFALTFVLTVTLFVGCGCTNQNMDNTSAPTVLPTNEEIWNTTEAATRATTESTMATRPSETTEQGNGPLEDSAGVTGNTNNTETDNESNTAQGRVRSAMPNMQ